MAAATCILPRKFSDLNSNIDGMRASMEPKEGSSNTHRMSSASCVTASHRDTKPSTQHSGSDQMMTRHRRRQQVLHPPVLHNCVLFVYLA